MRPLLLLPGILFFTVGSSGCREDENDECRHGNLEQTQEGYRVQLPTLQSQISRETLFGWVDTRIKQWVESHPDRNPDDLWAIARNYPYLAWDDYRFASLSSPTGFANGEIALKEKYDCPYVRVCIYSRGTAETPPSDAPPHTIRWNGESWSYGYLPNEVGFAAIPHELDHAIGIHHLAIHEPANQKGSGSGIWNSTDLPE